MSDIDEVFTSLFFGGGAWLGLMLFVVLMIGLTYKAKELGILMFPISILLGIEYLDAGLGWHSFIMFCTTLFIVFFIVKESKE